MGPGDWEFIVKGRVAVKTPTQTHYTGANGERVKVPSKTVTIARIRAWAHVLVFTRGGTEYVLPFVLAATPIAYVVTRWIARAL